MKGTPKRKLAVTPNVIDKVIEYISPTHAARRMRARLALSIANSYDGASKVNEPSDSGPPSGMTPTQISFPIFPNCAIAAVI